MPATHRTVRCLERALRSHVQTIREISLQTGKIKGGSSRQKIYYTLENILGEETTKQTDNSGISRGTEEWERFASVSKYFITDIVQNCWHMVTIKSNYF